MRYLVTGGLGFIGHNLVQTLIADGNTVRILDNGSSACVSSEFCTSRKIDLMEGDISDAATCRDAATLMDVVVHLAAQTGVPSSLSDPSHDLATNGIGTLNMLEAASQAGVRRFVLASSNAVFGEQSPPLHEVMVPRPLSPYGVSKLAAEGYCRVYHQNFGLETCALRFANIYGPGSHGKVSVVAKLIKRILEGQPLEVYGDGNQTRDFVYVGDIVQALCLASESEVSGEVFTIATGKETTVNELIERITKLADYDPRIPHSVKCNWKSARLGDVERNYSSIEKAHRLLGYSPKVALEQGIEETWEWFLETTRGLQKKVA